MEHSAGMNRRVAFEAGWLALGMFHPVPASFDRLGFASTCIWRVASTVESFDHR